MNDATSAGLRPRTASADGRATAARRPTAHVDADRHSRRVRILKLVLPSLGVVALALVAGLTWVKMHFTAGVDVRNVLFSKDGLTMVEPRLSGRAQGRTYDFSAARAFQSIADPKVVRMEVIDGHVDLADGTSVKIDSKTGVYDGNHETLQLDEGVVIVGSNGWRAEGKSADVALTDGRIVAREPLAISGPNAHLTADSLDLTDNGHHALFTGNVRMTVRPSDAAAASASSNP
ncbi:MAG: LPS export ABC transporter periplasmic protein LptC [Hyphomicrobiales bacterium]|nr:LPS export ABC transporter periplasmic protein LptC [Hyphomicrobiales bacterium]